MWVRYKRSRRLSHLRLLISPFLDNRLFPIFKPWNDHGYYAYLLQGHGYLLLFKLSKVDKTRPYLCIKKTDDTYLRYISKVFITYLVCCFITYLKGWNRCVVRCADFVSSPSQFMRLYQVLIQYRNTFAMYCAICQIIFGNFRSCQKLTIPNHIFATEIRKQDTRI